MQPEISKSMVGYSQQYIVSTMGAPNRETTDGTGGLILTYENTTLNSIATAYNVNYFTGTYTPGFRTTSHTDYIHVYINSQGICYKVKTNITRPEPKLDIEGTIGTIFGTIAIIVLTIMAVSN